MTEQQLGAETPIRVDKKAHDNNTETPIIINNSKSETERQPENEGNFTTLEALAKGEITNILTLKEKNTITRESQVERAQISHDGASYEAIIKRQSGQVGMDFPGGKISGETMPQREFAAFVVVNALGLDYVPTTALRQDNNELVSAQSYIADSVPGNKSYWDEDKGYSVRIDPFTEWNIGEDEFVEVAALSHLLGQVDGHPGNVILGGDKKIHMIDNALTFPDKSEGFYNNASLIRKFAGKPIPERLMTALQTLVDADGKLTEKGASLTEKLQALVSPAEVAAFSQRLNQLNKLRAVPSPDR